MLWTLIVVLMNLFNLCLKTNYEFCPHYFDEYPNGTQLQHVTPSLLEGFFQLGDTYFIYLFTTEQSLLPDWCESLLCLLKFHFAPFFSSHEITFPSFIIAITIFWNSFFWVTVSWIWIFRIMHRIAWILADLCTRQDACCVGNMNKMHHRIPFDCFTSRSYGLFCFNILKRNTSTLENQNFSIKAKTKLFVDTEKDP